MKKIIIFESATDSLKTFARLMGEGFEKLGYPVLLSDMDDLVTTRERIYNFADMHNTVAIFFNHIGLNLLTEERSSIWNELDIDCYNMIVDHPMYYHEAIIFPIRKLTFLCVDRYHKKFIDRFYPNRVRSIFFPHAGIQANIPDIPFEKRSIDVLFMGAYLIDDSVEFHTAGLGDGIKELWITCYKMLCEKMHMTIEQAVEACLSMKKIQLSNEDIKDTVRLFKDMDGMLRSKVRANAVKILVNNNIKVHVYGEGWEYLKCNKDNLTIHERIPFDATIPLIAEAKINLNVMPWFKSGIHDRVYSALLNKSVCLTDVSEYIEETLKDGENAIFFHLDNMEELPPKVKYYLDRPELLQRIARNGYAYSKETQTWFQRAKELAELFEQKEEGV